MDSFLMVGAGIMVGQWARIGAVPVLLGAALVLWALRRRGLGLAALAWVAGAMALGFWRADRQLAQFERARSTAILRLVHPDRCEGSVRVVSSPIWLHPPKPLGVPMGEEGREPSLGWDGAAQSLVCGGRDLGQVVVRLYGGPPDLGRGDSLEVVADLAPVELLRNIDVDDPTPRAARRGVVLSGRVQEAERTALGSGFGGLIDRFRAKVRARIEATFAPLAAPLARALVLGETDLDPADDQAFRGSGLSHLLAVSGTHLVLAVVTVVRALEAVARRVETLAARLDVGRLSAVFGVALAWAYADFAGGSGSARRAAAMLSFGMCARALGRRPRAERSFGLSLFSGALLDPLVGFDASFVLSVAATAGMMSWKRPLANALAGGSWRGAEEAGKQVGNTSRLSRWRHLWADAASTTLAASGACAPYLVLLAPTLSVGGLFANLLAVPVGELAALPLCLVHALLSPWPAMERGAAILASGSLLVVRGIAHATTDISWLAVSVSPPSAWQLAVLAGCVGGVSTTRGLRRVAIVLTGLAAWLLFELVAVRAGAPRGHLRITFIDVGQGDSALIDLPAGGSMLVDGGGALGGIVDPGRAAVAPLLRARRRRRLDIVVLSHPHPDHVGGLPAALEGVEVGEIWDNGQGESEAALPAYDALMRLARAGRIPVRRPDWLCGKPRLIAGATVQVLAPCPGALAFADANDNSIVLRLGLGGRSALLAGDLPSSVEAKLLADWGEALRADVLKVGHHGSRTSTSPGWLEAIRPANAVISAGVRNRFGHPSPAALARLRANLVAVERTDQVGSVIWETDGNRVWLTSAVGVGGRPR